MRRYDDQFGLTRPERHEIESELLNQPNEDDLAGWAYDVKHPHTMAVLGDSVQRAASVPMDKRILRADSYISRGDPRGERMMLDPAPVWVRVGDSDHFVKIHPAHSVPEGVNHLAFESRLKELGRKFRYEPQVSMWFPFFPSGSERRAGRNLTRWSVAPDERRYGLPINFEPNDGDDAREADLAPDGLQTGYGVVGMRGGKIVLGGPLHEAMTEANGVGILGVPRGGITPEHIDTIWGRDRYGEPLGPENRELFGALHETKVPFESISLAGDFEDPTIPRHEGNPLVLAHVPDFRFKPTPGRTWFYDATPEGPKHIPHVHSPRNAEGPIATTTPRRPWYAKGK